MSNLMSNIRKASLPLQESSAQLGRLLLQLGQAADSQLDAETLAELDKQASVAACQELEKAASAAAAAAPEGGEAGGSTEEENSTAVEEAGADERKKDECVANEESSTATTVELSADSSHHEDAGSSSSSSGHVPQQQAGGSDSSATPGGADASSSSSSSLMRASSVHSTNSSSHAVASSSSSSSRHGGAPSPLPRSARSSREASLVFPGGILSAPVRKEEQPPPPPAGGGGEEQEEEEEEEEEEAPAAKPAAAAGPVKVMLQGFALQADDDKLVVCESKALAHLFTRIRNRDTPPPVFRFYATRMMRILAEEGIACLESSRQFITTPTAATFSSPFVNESNVCIVSILRAGDALAEAAQACIPTAPVGKILIQRDEESSDKHPVLFYKKLPSKIAKMQVLLCDPMLATGGSALMAIRCLVEAGVKEASIVFITVVVCPEGIGALRAEFPEVTIVTGAMDDCLDEKRYILPGLGDFGDRFFGTVS